MWSYVGRRVGVLQIARILGKISSFFLDFFFVGDFKGRESGRLGCDVDIAGRWLCGWSCVWMWLTVSPVYNSVALCNTTHACLHTHMQSAGVHTYLFNNNTCHHLCAGRGKRNGNGHSLFFFFCSCDIYIYYIYICRIYKDVGVTTFARHDTVCLTDDVHRTSFGGGCRRHGKS